MRALLGAAFAATVALAGCGSPVEPPPAEKPVVRKPPPPTPTPAPLPAPTPSPQAAPPAEPLPPPPAPSRVEGPPPAPVVEKGPQPGTEFDPAISTPSFNFRTMDHHQADVFINGHFQSTTVCLWSATLNTAFDPKIPVPVWPPPGAKPCGWGLRRLDDGTPCSTAELFIEGGHYEQEDFASTRKRLPHLAEGEQIVYVRAKWGAAERTGALRLRVVGKDGALYRWIDYVAWLSDEDENASMFKRALWFYAFRPE